MKYKKRRKIKWKRVLFVLLPLIIIIGGIIMYQNKFFITTNKKENIKTEKKESSKEENKQEETIDVNDSLEKAPNNHIDFKNLADGEYITENGYTLKIENKTATIDGLLIVNKTYSIPETYQPKNPIESINGQNCINCLEQEVMNAFKSMQSDAKGIGLNIYLASGYRSYSYQNMLYTNYTIRSGKEQADTYSARPGHSEHQTGLCFDLNSVDDSFANTNEGRWVNENASNYGFIIRYPKGKDHITGYQYESWHLRYVGENLAKELYQEETKSWITLEEYYGITSNYGS